MGKIVGFDVIERRRNYLSISTMPLADESLSTAIGQPLNTNNGSSSHLARVAERRMSVITQLDTLGINYWDLSNSEQRVVNNCAATISQIADLNLINRSGLDISQIREKLEKDISPSGIDDSLVYLEAACDINRCLIKYTGSDHADNRKCVQELAEVAVSGAALKEIYEKFVRVAALWLVDETSGSVAFHEYVNNYAERYQELDEDNRHRLDSTIGVVLCSHVYNAEVDKFFSLVDSIVRFENEHGNLTTSEKHRYIYLVEVMGKGFGRIEPDVQAALVTSFTEADFDIYELNSLGSECIEQNARELVWLATEYPSFASNLVNKLGPEAPQLAIEYKDLLFVMGKFDEVSPSTGIGRGIANCLTPAVLQEYGKRLHSLLVSWTADVNRPVSYYEHLKHFDLIPDSFFTQNGKELFELFDRYGIHSLAMIATFWDETLNLELEQRAFFDDLKEYFESREIDDRFGAFISFLDVAIVQDHADFVLETIKLNKARSYIPFHELKRKGLIVSQPDLVRDIAQCCGPAAGDALNKLAAMDYSFVSRHSERISELAKITRSSMPEVLASLPLERFGEIPESFMEQARKYGSAYWGLQKSFGLYLPEAVSLYVEDVDRICEAYGTGAGKFFAEVPRNYWDLYADSLLKRFGTAAGDVFAAYGHAYFANETEDERLALDKARSVFGMMHTHRYCPCEESSNNTDSEDFSVAPGAFPRKILQTDLLEENFRNLDPNRNSDRPLALFVYPRWDWNGVYADQYPVLKEMVKKYKLLIYEVETEEELQAAVETVGSLHGLRRDGSPRKPIDLLVVSAHGRAMRVNLGNLKENVHDATNGIKRKGSPLLSTLHDHVFGTINRFMRRGGKFAFSSCLVGFGGDKMKNFITSVHAKLPHLQLTGPRTTANSAQGVILGKDGLFRELNLDIPRGKILRLEPIRQKRGISFGALGFAEALGFRRAA